MGLNTDKTSKVFVLIIIIIDLIIIVIIMITIITTSVARLLAPREGPPWSAWPSSTIMAGEAVYSLTSTKLITIDRLGSGIQVTVILKKIPAQWVD